MSSPPSLRPTAAGSGRSSSGGSYSVVHHRRRHGRPAGVTGLSRRPRVRRRCKMMRLTYLLMDDREDVDEQRRQRRSSKRVADLEFEVSELEATLDREQRLGRVLRCSLRGQGRVVCHCCLSSALLVPNKVRSLLGELAMVEDEIFYLEKKVDDLRMRLHRDREWNDQHVAVQQSPQDRQPRRRSSRGLDCRNELTVTGVEQLPRLPRRPASASDETTLGCDSNAASVGSVPAAKGDEVVEHVTRRRSSHCRSSSENRPIPPADRKTCPNKLSEELIRLTVTVFHKLMNRTAGGEPARLNISSCIIGSRTRSLVPKAAAPFTAMSPLIKGRGGSRTTPKEEEEDAAARRHGGFVEFTRGSVDVSRVSSSCLLVDIKNLRGLMQKLSAVDPSFLTNKQKLAFWINVYNFCVMHAFLQQGLPPSPDKLLALLNQASVNVGGTVLSVLSIEHLILRHPPHGKQLIDDGKKGIVEEGERRDLVRSYGLGFPEPNVIFALCRGSRSSPALRVYTAEDVSNELERAKVEYLESSVRAVGGRRQRAVAVPRLLHWHMRDFADDAASLLEWVHSQLPRASAGPLRRAIREVLGATGGDGGGRAAAAKVVVEVEPYDAEFCYLLPVW